jgi:hypothetical protein
MKMKKLAPIHPCEILAEDFMKPQETIGAIQA